MHKVLSLHNLHKTFIQGEKSLEVLKGINLEVHQGELVALVGSSGSGKSTLLQIAGLLDRPGEGEIYIDGQALGTAGDTDRTNARRDRLGFIYQFHHLLPDFTALENVKIAGRIQKMNEKSAFEKAMELLTSLGLEERIDHTPSKLSGGEQQRVAIARALMGSPRVLLADEPTGNLDDESSNRVFEQLLHVAKEKKVAALIATHDRRLAEKTDHQYRLHGGQLTPL